VEDGQTKTREVEIKKKEIEYVPHARREAQVGFRIGVIGMADGKFIGQDEFADGRRINAEGDSEIHGMPGEQTMLDEMLEKLSTRFVNCMTPHEVTEYIKMQSDKSSKEAIKLARAGKWDESIAMLEDVTNAEPSNAVVLYNLGIANEHEGRLEKAREYYREAMKLSNKPLYNEAWVRVHDIIQQNEKLKKQLGGR
jgi:tetratricopeptide (TPR) repeat protein